jgi:prepilin-type processing-associated H-X9-DG protein
MIDQGGVVNRVTENSTRCEETRRALSAYIAGTLEPEKSAALEAHVSVCEACHVALEEAHGGEEQLSLHQEEGQPEDLGPGRNSYLRAALLLSLLLAGTLLFLLNRGADMWRRGESIHNLKHIGLAFRIYADDSKNKVYPPLAPQDGVWAPHLDGFFREFFSEGTPFVVLHHPNAARLHKEMDTAFAQDPLDAEAIARISTESFVYLGYVVRDLSELSQFAQGVAAYAPEQRLEGIPTEDGGLLPRLRTGVEKFYLTDVNDEAAAQQIAATIPVMFEIPYPEGHPRHQVFCYVLYLDGHVAPVPYGDAFPALREVAELMEEAGALR